jgi:putative ABC transport system permease protein
VVVLGDKVVQDLFGNNTTPLDKLVTMDGKVYTVVGVLEKIGGGGFGGVADNIALIPTTTYKKYFNPNNYVELYVRAKEEAGADKAAAEIKRALSRKLDPDSDFTVFTQAQLLESLNSILGAVTGALGGIAAISLLVGGIGIMNIMLVSVTERTREIGLRKAVGAKPMAILLQFILEAVVLSLFGGLVGILVGAGGAGIINQFITTQVTLPAVGLAFGVSVLIGIVFGTAPAVSAARKDPIIALRYE